MKTAFRPELGQRLLGGLSGSLRSRKRGRQLLWVAVFLLPGLLVFGLFLFYPTVQTLYEGFMSVKIYGRSITYHWVGLKHFVEAFNDPVFLTAVRNTLIWGAWGLVDIPLAIALAAIIAFRFPGHRFYRVLWFLPILVSSVLVALTWDWLLNLNGPVNAILHALHLSALVHDWMGHPATAIISLLIMSTWQSAGFYMIIVLAAFESIPRELYDAARLDGANSWQVLSRVLIPLSKPALVTAAIISFTYKMKMFDLVWLATQGGPYDSTHTVSTYIIYRSFYYVQGNFSVGYPAAMSAIWFVVMALGIWLITRAFRARQSYQF